MGSSEARRRGSPRRAPRRTGDSAAGGETWPRAPRYPEAVKADGPRGAGGPEFFRSPVARVVLALGVGLCAFVAVVTMLPQPTVRTTELAQDTSSLRNVAYALIRAAAPLAADGRLDAFGALAAIARPEQVIELCFSARSRKGPTAAEVEARDYANFPWQRRRGAFDPRVRPPVPILWERERMEAPVGDLCRAVAYSDGSVRVLVGDEDAAMIEFFRDNAGQR